VESLNNLQTKREEKKLCSTNCQYLKNAGKKPHKIKIKLVMSGSGKKEWLFLDQMATLTYLVITAHFNAHTFYACSIYAAHPWIGS
jgi:hypothetical protein